MIRFLGIMLMVLGLAGALIVGISGGVSPWRESDFVERNALGLRHALAFVCASSLVSLALIRSIRSRWQFFVAVLAAIGFAAI